MALPSLLELADCVAQVYTDCVASRERFPHPCESFEIWLMVDSSDMSWDVNDTDNNDFDLLVSVDMMRGDSPEYIASELLSQMLDELHELAL